MESIQALASRCRVAAAHDAVLNTECCYTFHSPYTSPAGILVNLESFMGTVQELAMMEENHPTETSTATPALTQEGIFVRIVKQRVLSNEGKGDVASMEVEEVEEAATAAETEIVAAPTKLGIGMAGGFLSDDDKYETLSKLTVVVLRRNDVDQIAADTGGPSPVTATITELPYSDQTKASFPMQVAASVDSILQHVGMTVQQDVKVWQLDADEDMVVSKYASDVLPFVENGVVIDPHPTTWKCQKTGATDNIWLNLSDGYIGGGRQNWDGSGGSNGALDHYEQTGKLYPLVVKLGTITADLSTADCYSYAPDEDGPVHIPNLAALLEKRGIMVAGMQKTAKSTAEMEVELNANYAFDAITEAGAQLEPLAGPGLQGLQNLGNSCYMNAVVQLLLSGTVVELAHRYGTTANSSVTQHELLRRVSTRQAPADLLCQTTKVACALTSGVFAQPPEVLSMPEQQEQEQAADSSSASASNDPKYRLAPRMLKHVVGKDHVDFRTGQQQDAAQFLQYFLERLDRAEQGAAAVLTKQHADRDAADADADADADTPSGTLHVASDIFSFATSSRMVCSADQRVKYKDSTAPETVWSLRLPMDKAVVVAAVDKEKEKEAGGGQAGASATIGGIDVPDHKRFKPEESKEEDKKPIPTIAFQTCVEEWAADTQVDDLRWAHLDNAVHAATEQTRFRNFPRYLLIQIQRYQLGPDWQPMKLEVNLDIPQEIDLTAFKSTGPVEGENLIPAEETSPAQETASGAAAAAAAGPAVFDEGAVSQLMDMGFSLNSCKRALTAVGGSDVEAAMGWVFEHNMDPDFNDPLPEPTQGGAPAAKGAGAGAPSGDSGTGVDEGVVQSLVENLGCFTADHVRAALKETSGAADRAADWLFSHMDDLEGAIAALESKHESSQPSSASASAAGPKVPLEDGEGKYTMVGLVSHIGKNTGSGHYVAHLKKDGQWVIFNDEKVARSSQPPIQHAYMYLFQRTDSVGAPNPNY